MEIEFDPIKMGVKRITRIQPGHYRVESFYVFRESCGRFGC